MTQHEAIVFQVAHLFAQTELSPGLSLPGLRTEEQTQGLIAEQISDYRKYMGGLFQEIGLKPTDLKLPQGLTLVVAEAEIISPYDDDTTIPTACVLTEEELVSVGESADDFIYTDVPRNVDGVFSVKVNDVQRSRTTLEPLFAGKEGVDYSLQLTEKAIALEVWMGLGEVAFTGFDPRIYSDDVPSDVFTKLAAHMVLPHEGLDFDGTYNTNITNMLIAARQRFAGALAYQGIRDADVDPLDSVVLLDTEIELLKAVHKSLFQTQVQTGHYRGDLRQFALAHPLSEAELVESIRILTS